MNQVNAMIEKLKLSDYTNNKVVQLVSKKTKLKPEMVVFVSLILSALFLILTNTGQNFLLILISFMYPAYKSFKALESKDHADNERWLIYWTVFGLIFAFKNLFMSILCLFPGSNLILTLVLFTIYCPLTNGYKYFYDMVARPLLKYYQNNIEKYLNMASDELKDKANRIKKTVKDELVK